MKNIVFNGKNAILMRINGKNVVSANLNGSQVWVKRTTGGKWTVNVCYDGKQQTVLVDGEDDSSIWSYWSGMMRPAIISLNIKNRNGIWQCSLSYGKSRGGSVGVAPGFEEFSCSGSIAGEPNATTLGRIDMYKNDVLVEGVYIESATWSAN